MLPSASIRVLSLLSLSGFLLAAPPEASARGRRHHHHHHGVQSETYMQLKAGSYDLDSFDAGPGHDDGLDGLFLGIEMGVSPSPFVELGFSADWLRRREGREEILIVDAPYELPVNGVVDLDGTSTDLVPLGGVARLKFPVAGGRFIPFVAGQLTYDILRLSYHEIATNGGQMSVSEQSEYFHGFAHTISLGVEARLDSAFGIVLELGGHESTPSKDLELNGVPVRGEVDASGGFARIAMRFAFQ